MLKLTRLPEDLIDGVVSNRNPFEVIVEKRTIEGIDEIQCLSVTPRTSIKMHGNNSQWEVWVRISHKTAHICLIGEEHELVNNTEEKMVLMAIKGHKDYSYEDLADIFINWGFSVSHGSLIVNS